MASSQTSEDSGAVSKTTSSIESLPTEVLERVAGNLKATERGAFRLTSKTIQAKTARTFAKAVIPDHTLKVDLTPAWLQRARTLLSFDDISEHVHQISFDASLRVAPATALCEPLQHLLEKLPYVEGISIFANSTALPFTWASLFLDALIAHPLPNLHSLSIEALKVPVSHIHNALVAHATTLRSLFLRLAIDDRPLTGDHECHSMLAYARDHMDLDHLNIENFVRPFHDIGTTANVHRAFRSPTTKEIETYSITYSRASMLGKRAVKLGINELLKKVGSSLYDPSLPAR